ncbi:MAG: hypothetical protein D3M94_22330 [Rhodocyclales bacterium GT-UBC]|nr:MAG: hypothetical protein D3M94_22330 [Rhodocyclales bacterium GT-UBC]
MRRVVGNAMPDAGQATWGRRMLRLATSVVIVVAVVLAIAWTGFRLANRAGLELDLGWATALVATFTLINVVAIVGLASAASLAALAMARDRTARTPKAYLVVAAAVVIAFGVVVYLLTSFRVEGP